MPAIDTERFRLRNFVDKLVEAGECEVHGAPIDLVDVGGVLDGNPHAVLFKAVGPEKAELVGNVMASRRRIAAALDVPRHSLPWPAEGKILSGFGREKGLEALAAYTQLKNVCVKL